MTTVDRPAALTPLDELRAQLQGMELWHAARRATERALTEPRLSREARLDARRRLDVRRREHAALIARLNAEADGPCGQLPSRVVPTAVVAHRHAWTRDQVAKALRASGYDVVLVTDNGADAVGVCVVQQPTLLVVDELLAMRSGCEVLQEVRQFCLHTRVVAYVQREAAVAPLLDAGATAVCTKRLPPAGFVEAVTPALPA